jgi:hypothetical protein
MEIASRFSFFEKEWFEGSRRRSMNLHEETQRDGTTLLLLGSALTRSTSLAEADEAFFL